MARFMCSAVAIFVVLATISFQRALALQCWKCTNLVHKHCSDPFDPSELIDENGFQNYVQCATKCLKVKAHDPSSKVTAVIRGCAAYVDTFKENCTHIPPESPLKFCQYCDTDGCNGTNEFGPVTLLVVISVVIAKNITTMI